MVTIYHNPNCSNSRGALALIREAGIEPTVIEYLQAPPSRDELKSLIERMGMRVRDVMRQKEPIYEQLKLDRPELSDHELIEAMLAHPILMNRPIVVTPLGVKLCRPPEEVMGILPKAA